jgi:hypothetical protein
METGLRQVIAEPRLNLTLNEVAVSDRGALNHLGIQVPTTAHVLQARERLQKAELMTLDEMNVDCCYALQDKIWVTDPNGYRWEIFTVKVSDTQPELNISAESDSAAQRNASCCRQ